MLSQELPFSLDHFHQRRRGIINSNRILTVCLCVHLKEAISHSDVSETLSLQPVKTENMVKRVVNSLDIVRLWLLLCYDSVDTKYLLCNAGDMKGKVNECSQYMVYFYLIIPLWLQHGTFYFLVKHVINCPTGAAA